MARSSVLFHADGHMVREKAVAFIAISFMAIVFVLKTFSVLHSKGLLLQGPREQRPVDTVRVAEVGARVLVPVFWGAPQPEAGFRLLLKVL